MDSGMFWQKPRMVFIDEIVINKMIVSYLFKRRQKVINKNSWSSFEPLSAGVPQGSVVDPLLFIIYINDIEEKLLSLNILFADDTSSGYPSQSVHFGRG
jgi:retron-type reverse transcriptase